MLIFILIVVILILIFILQYKFTYSKIINGFVFLTILFTIVVGYTFAAFIMKNQILMYSAVIIDTILSLIVLLSGFIVITTLILSARKLFKKEARTFSNSLVLISLFVILLGSVVIFFLPQTYLPSWLKDIFVVIFILMLSYCCHGICFFTSVILASHPIVKKNKDYLIVLGSGLINGEVPPLLASRIEAALKFYHKQKKATKAPTIIFSGGQGDDEPRPEAIAMQEYALEKGIPIEDTLVETKSLNTYQNLLYSQKIMRADSQKINSKCLFMTSDYHVFRAAGYARQLGLNCFGIGAKTIWYYYLNAVLREYVAYIWKDKKLHLIYSIIVFLSVVGINNFN